MMLLISVFIGVALFFYWSYADSRKEVWCRLVDLYPGEHLAKSERDYKKTKKVFFKLESEKTYDYHNIMFVVESRDSVKIDNSFTTILVKPIKIPKENLEYIGKKMILLGRRKVYKVVGTNILLAI